MEKHESNKERVVEQNNLFEIGSEVDAKNVLCRVIDEVSQNVKSADVSVLKSREYHEQIKTLIDSWEQLLLVRKQ